MIFYTDDKKMKKAIKTAFVLAALIVGAAVSCEAAEGGEVLWWLIDTDYETITGETIQGTTMTAKELGVNGARIRYQSGDEIGGYLPLLGLDDNDNLVEFNGINGVELPAEYFGSLSGISGASYSFVLELGNWANGQWVSTSMESRPAEYAALVQNQHITQWHGLTPSYAKPWTPTQFQVVPEPNSGILLLVGGAFLMLRRRRNVIS